jgi:hypothetical protein
MLRVKPWKKRPTEEANLFNPAFVGSLIFEFSKAYSKHQVNGTPVTFVPLALSVVLHKPTRVRLPGSTVTSLYDWLLKNEVVLIGLSDRARNITPISKEALRFLMMHNCIDFSEGHNVIPGTKKAHFPTAFLNETTSEMKNIVEKTKFLARWFAKSGSENSTLASVPSLTLATGFPGFHRGRIRRGALGRGCRRPTWSR